MVDATAKPAVTDSRFPGFNPEVEESHAAAAAATAPAAAAEVPATAAPLAPVKPEEYLVGLLTAIVDHLGNREHMLELLEQVKDALKHA